ncbi:O-methyltransferase [Paenibacillus sp. 1001270B_150601_E10]|uniref:O-methyltransferase n=1 Tax=Paenibacillus sp. 1001270B_150601_E10 TaxID=2787079 RepID=UPI002B4BA9DF|nr:class I SAM-dependent methyltransferase [Paenibacillus sp. 1001270B_150601_E10]
MVDDQHMAIPAMATRIQALAVELGFTMSCDNLTGALLRVLVASKPQSRILELGTGAGYSTAWILEGMDESSTLTTVEYDSALAEIARTVIQDLRVEFHVCDGAEFISSHHHEQYDIIFADTWPGKFHLLDEVLSMVKPSGLYIIDDLNPQPNWPEGHQSKVDELIQMLDQRKDYHYVKLNWSTGLMILTKK